MVFISLVVGIWTKYVYVKRCLGALRNQAAPSLSFGFPYSLSRLLNMMGHEILTVICYQCVAPLYSNLTDDVSSL